MQLLPRDESLLVKQTLVPWAPYATNAPALRSLLLQQGNAGTELYIRSNQQAPSCRSDDPDPNHSCSSYVVVKLPHQQRFMLIGNAQVKPDYEHACASIMHTFLQQPQQQQHEGFTAEPQRKDSDSDRQQQEQAYASHQPQQQQQQVVRLRAIPSAAVQQVRAAFTEHGFEESYCSSGLQYIVEQESLKQQLLAPDLQRQLLQQIGSDQYEFDVLQPEDAEYVNENWIYRAPGSLAQVQQVITSSSRHTSCIRQLPSKQPVAWALEMEPGYLGLLHTVEQYRRKGLGRAVLLDLLSKLYKAHLQENVEVHQSLTGCSTSQGTSCSVCSRNSNCSRCSCRVLQNGRVGPCTDGRGSAWPGGAVYCYVMQGNSPSVALLESVGLVRAQECWWMGFERTPVGDAA